MLKSPVTCIELINMFLSFILQRCDGCGQSGATVGCCLATCQSNFHFMCARAQNCVFQLDRKVYCSKHRDLVSAKVLDSFPPPKLLHYIFSFVSYFLYILSVYDYLFHSRWWLGKGLKSLGGSTWTLKGSISEESSSQGWSPKP